MSGLGSVKAEFAKDQLPQCQNKLANDNFLHTMREFSLSRIILTPTVLFLVFVLPFAAFLCFYNLGVPPLWGTYTAVDEGRHVHVAQEMWLSGNFLRPTLDGVPYFLKPPFKMWLTLIPAHLLGESYTSYRLIDAMLGFAMVVLVFRLAWLLFRSRAAGLFAALFLLSNHHFFHMHGLRSAVQDTMMLFLTSLLMFFGWKRVSSDTARISKSAGFSLGLLLGLAALTKSVAAYYPIFIFGLFLLLRGRLFSLLRQNFVPLLVFSLTAIILPALYFVPNILLDDVAYSHAVQHEVLERFGRGIHNVRKPYFYYSLLASGVIAPFLPLVLSCGYSLYAAVVRRRSEYLFVCVWGLLPVLAFSALKSRLPWYLGPCYLAFALMLGVALSKIVESLSQLRRQVFEANSARIFALCLQGIFLLGLLGLFIAGLGKALVGNLQDVMRLREPLALEKFADSYIGYLEKNKEGEMGERKLLLFGTPEFSTNEGFAHNILKPHFSSAKDFSQFKELCATGEYFCMSSGEIAHSLLSQSLEYHYFILPAEVEEQGANGRKRLAPIVVLAKGPGSSGQMGFSSSTTIINLQQFATESLLYGWSSKLWGGVARVVLGEGAALMLPANVLHQNFGARLSLKLARDGSSTKPGLRAKVLVNSRVIGEIEEVPADFSHFSFQVPAGMLREGGRNLLQFLLEYQEGGAIPSNSRSLLVQTLKLSFVSTP